MHTKLDLKLLGKQTTTLLLADLAIPPLPTTFVEVASFCGLVAQQCGGRLVTADDHAVALFHKFVSMFAARRGDSGGTLRTDGDRLCKQTGSPCGTQILARDCGAKSRLVRALACTTCSCNKY